MPNTKRDPSEKLWCVSVHHQASGRSETIALVFAKDDGEAMRRGFALLEEWELLAQKQEAYHVPKREEDEAGDDADGFFSCEPIEDEDDLEAALDGIPALADFSDLTGGIASITWPVITGER